MEEGGLTGGERKKERGKKGKKRGEIMQKVDAFLLNGFLKQFEPYRQVRQGLCFWTPHKETWMLKSCLQVFLIIFPVGFVPFSAAEYLCLTQGIWLHNQNLSCII